MRCHCDSMMPYELCCKPFIEGEKDARTALALMRSRFSAHVEKQPTYILNTYGERMRANIKIEEIKLGLNGIEWEELEILSVSKGQFLDEEGLVEFLAHYRQGVEQLTMHERSLFRKEHGLWRYVGPSK